MSWLFCVLSNKPFLKWEIDKFLELHLNPSLNKIKPSFYLAVGGSEKNICFKYDNYEEDSGFVVIGNGYLKKDTGFGIAEKNDWIKFINGEIPSEDMNGQFAVLKWNTQFLEAWNDTLGLKDLYFSKSQGYVIISSRLDWVSEFLNKKPWNYDAFGAMTLLPNMLLPQSLLKNVFRLGMGGYVKANNSKFHLGNRKQKITSDELDPENRYFFNLNRAINLHLDIDQKIIMPADNNFNNRYLLSYFLNKAKKNWSELEPDPALKDELEHFLQFQNVFLIPSEQNPGLDDKNRLLNLWNDYILSEVSANLPAELNFVQLFSDMNKNDYSLYLPLSHNFFIHKSNYLESRLLLKGIEENNPEYLLKYFGDDYSWLRKEFYLFLKKGALNHLTEFLEYMNNQNLNSSEQKLQFMHFHLDSINHNARKTEWLNRFGNVYSPYLLNELFKLRLNLNLQNSELYKLYLAQLEKNYPELLFHLKFKETRIDLRQSSSLDHRLFDLFKDDIIETLSSKEIKHSPYYNHKKLDKIINKLNSGHQNYKKIALKCYAFELWRKQLEKN